MENHDIKKIKLKEFQRDVIDYFTTHIEVMNRKTWSQSDYVDFILSKMKPFAKVKELKTGLELFYTFDDGLWIPIQEKILPMMMQITQVSKQNLKDSDVKFVKGTIAEILSGNMMTNIIDSKTDFITIKINPQGYLKNKDNSVLDLKTKEVVNDEKILEKIGFTRRHDFNLNKTSNIDNDLYQAIDEMFNVYSDYNPETKLFYQRVGFATMEGYGRKKLIILDSTGGLGKSTFLNMIAKVSYGYVGIQADDLENNDDMLDLIQPKHSLIVGDDLSSGTQLFTKRGDRLKSMVTGGVVSFTPKYKGSKQIVFDGLIIQATNEIPKFYDDRGAVERRIILQTWSVKKDNLLILEKKYPNVEEMIQHELFPITFAKYLLDNVDYFDKFNLTKLQKLKIDEVLNETNPFDTFVNDTLLNDMDMTSIIIPNLAYHAYKDVMRDISSSKFTFANKRFNTQLKTILENHNYSQDRNKKITIKRTSFKEYNPFAIMKKQDFLAFIDKKFISLKSDYAKGCYDKWDDRVRFFKSNNPMILEDKEKILLDLLCALYPTPHHLIEGDCQNDILKQALIKILDKESLYTLYNTNIKEATAKLEEQDLLTKVLNAYQKIIN